MTVSLQRSMRHADRVPRSLLAAALLVALAAAARADGPATLVWDIAPGVDPTATSDPQSFVLLGDVALFVAADSHHGTELWRTDGTAAGTLLVKDISHGVAGSWPSSLTVVNEVALFSADDGEHGSELWRTDGTTDGTVLLRDIAPGGAGSGPTQFVRFGDAVLFTADDGATGLELWRTDGTEAGTIQVVDISPGPRASAPRSLTVSGGHLFFVADDGTHGCELWRTDGTAAGTRLVKDTYPTDECTVHIGPPQVPFQRSVSPQSLTDVHGRLFFTANEMLWRSDGSESGTLALQSFGYCHGFEVFSCPPSCLSDVNGTLYFQAETDVGRELWTSDGSVDGTVLVKDINPRPCEFFAYSDECSSFPCGFQADNGTVFFTARDGDLQYGRWKTDGTADGTLPAPGPTPTPGPSPQPGYSVVLNGILIFGNGELYKSDGTEAGTELLKDINQRPADSSPAFIAELNGALLFFADDHEHGRELWRTDGSAPGTVLVKDIHPGASGSVDFIPVSRGLRLSSGILFIADDGVTGPELWKTDGTAAGTEQVADVLPGPDGGLATWLAYSARPELVRVGDLAFFTARGSGTGVELWRSDGTTAGTRIVKDIRPGEDSSRPQSLRDLDGTLLFTADDGVHGPELWRSDGTDGGTTMVADILPGESFVTPWGLTAVGRTLFFSAIDAAHGAELWVSDGTAAGTHMVKDINPGDAYASPQELTAVDGIVFFIADDGAHGPELWRSDGTESGTRLVRDITPGPDAHFIAYLTASSGLLFFNAGDAANDEELWVSDGSEAGTRRVRDLNPATSSFPMSLTDAGRVLLFLANDGVDGARLWRSDGTASGTFPVQNFATSGASIDLFGFPAAFVVSGGRVFFAADDTISGHELWSLPISALVGPCTGDCDGDAVVTVSELVVGVNIALGNEPVSTCPSFSNPDALVEVPELVRAVNNALLGCG